MWIIIGLAALGIAYWFWDQIAEARDYGETTAQGVGMP